MAAADDRRRECEHYRSMIGMHAAALSLALVAPAPTVAPHGNRYWSDKRVTAVELAGWMLFGVGWTSSIAPTIVLAKQTKISPLVPLVPIAGPMHVAVEGPSKSRILNATFGLLGAMQAVGLTLGLTGTLVRKSRTNWSVSPTANGVTFHMRF